MQIFWIWVPIISHLLTAFILFHTFCILKKCSRFEFILLLSCSNSSVERQSAAIRAIRDVEIERLLTELRLLRTYFNKEQLQTPALQFFAENFPNLSVVRNGENGHADLQWNTKEGEVDKDDRRDVHASLLHRLSIAYSDYSAPITSLGGFEFSTKAGMWKFLFSML